MIEKEHYNLLIKELEVLKQEMTKVKFQLELLSSSLSFEENPIAVLVNSLNWSSDDLDKAHDIFEKYDKMLENDKKDLINGYGFESEFEQEFGISYQTLKMIVLAFYYNSQWVDLCIEYAKANRCMEFDRILINKNPI